MRAFLGLLGVIIGILCGLEEVNAVFSCTLPQRQYNSRLPNPLVQGYSAYSAEYQMSYDSQNELISATEEYDFNQGKVKMTVFRNGNHYDYLADFKNDIVVETIFQNRKVTCKVDKLSTASSRTDKFHFFGKLIRNNTRHSVHPYAPWHVFDLGESSQFRYGGIKFMDGFSTHHWKACLSWDNDATKFSLDYYFAYKIGHSGPRVMFPVKAEVQGETKTGTATRAFHMIYDYFTFEVKKSLKPSVFDLYLGKKCQDDNGLLSRKIPAIPAAVKMTYTSEVIDGNKGTLKTRDVRYDPDKKLIRMKEGSLLQIDDFNSLTHYEINTDVIGRFGCRIKALKPGQYTSFKTSDNKQRMKTVEELLNINDKNKYQYSGSRTERGIRTDEFQGEKQWISYRMKGWQFRLSSDANITLPTSIFSVPGQRVNVLNYAINPPDSNTNPYDVTMCQHESNLKRFRLTFAGDYNTFYQLGWNNVIRPEVIASVHSTIQNKITDLLSLSPLHVHWTDVSISSRDYELYWDGVLVGPNPEETLPTNAPKTLGDAWNKLKNTLLVIKISVKYYSILLQLSQIDDLESFFQTVASKNNPLSKFTRYRNKNNIALYTKGSDVKTPIAADCASLCIQTKSFDCRGFRYCGSTQQCHLSRDDIDANALYDNSQCDLYERSYSADFTPLPGLALKPRKAELYGSVDSDDDCAKICASHAGYYCESFAFCPQSKECFVEKDRSEGDIIDGGQKPSCKRSVRNYLGDYGVSDSSALSSISSDHPLFTIKADGPELCAAACSKGSAVDGCGQFDFCGSSGQCHFVSASTSKYTQSESNVGCTTYTAKSAKPTIKQPSASGLKSGDSNSSSTSYSGGSMAALGIVLGLCGIAIACAAVFFIARRRGISMSLGKA